MTDKTQQERAEFEAWLCSLPLAPSKPTTILERDAAWLAWKAARASQSSEPVGHFIENFGASGQWIHCRNEAEYTVPLYRGPQPVAQAVPELSDNDIDAIDRAAANKWDFFCRVYELGAQRAAEAQSAELRRLQAEAEGLRTDKELLDAIDSHCWKLDPFETAEDDYGWRVSEYHMSEPRERAVAESFNSNVRDAITAAIAASKEPV